ncbi:hypothetical protein [uncultured Ruminococcus sp.]|uniref:hypothetical protein n=1 Tax=uncultured Ruminococcus sp. TaxID=165186 RepID=UPI002611723B|nr:hypothetical protein [uncultured Ruminococcus sp.]
MRKYNLSSIMKRAWEIIKKHHSSKSNALKLAWIEAKATIAEAAKPVFNGVAIVDSFKFVLWEKYGKRRIYINGYGDCIGKKGGYIDLDHDNYIAATGKAKSAADTFMETYRFA